MKRVYVNEKWCLGCHLCEYYCAFANSGKSSMVKALKDHKIAPRIRIEERNNISFAVSCRHCTDPLCVKGCISGALTIVDGAVQIDSGKCNWGIATQRPDLVKRLNPDIGSQRLINLVTAWDHELKEMMGGMGINSIEALRGNRLMLRGIGLTDRELNILGIKHAGE